MATKYLIELGHRKIAFLGRAYNQGLQEEIHRVDRDRLQGYKDTLRQHGLPVSNSLIHLANYSLHDGKQMMENLLHSGETFTAILAASDNIALGGCNVLYQNGLNIPEDISVMGFENILGEYFIKPPTVIDQSVLEMGQQSVKLLIEHIRSKEPFGTEEILLKPKLIPGETTASLSK